MAAKIRKGDEVIVIKGRDKGKKGEVTRVIPSERRAIVQGVNVVRRHTRPTAADPGGIINKESPIQLANVALVDPKSGEATRVGFRISDDGAKVRFAKKSGEQIDG